jgi:hypothetical protein
VPLPGVHESLGLEEADRLAHGHLSEAVLVRQLAMRGEPLAGFESTQENCRPQIVGYLLIGRPRISGIDRHGDLAYPVIYVAGLAQLH